MMNGYAIRDSVKFVKTTSENNDNYFNPNADIISAI